MVLNTFYCEWRILPENATRDACLTMFGGMTELDDLKEQGDVKLLGRWACVGEARGFCIAQAKTVLQVQAWLTNWVSMADIKVVPCLDDNQHRELILGTEPSYVVPYEKVNYPPNENESLYFVRYQFRDGCRDEGFKIFANLTEEDDQKDPGNCTSLGRWHVPSQGCGYAIASSPSVLDVYKWAYNWNALCDVEVFPVTQDQETRDIIKSGFGYEVKRKMLMEKMSKLSGSNSCFF